MVWYATTGEDREAGDADETADAASSAPGEFSCLAVCHRDAWPPLLSCLIERNLRLVIDSALA